MESDPTTYIPAFYAGRSIFITGSTGFMGKVLIEKLLRSCPNVHEIFLLMRPKKGVSIDNRLRKMLTLPLFDKLRDTDPSLFDKLIPVTGDVMEEGLGLPTIERKVIIEKVSVIFHAAANIRFDDPLKQAILMNIRGTREVCILAANMKKLVVFLHVSTTYGNTDRPVINEILYPPHANWKEAIKIAETIDDHTLNAMTAKYIGKLPNTYTFTKQLAEHVVNDYAGVIPSVIFRPSVVVSSLEEPVAGWIDNFNGPVGLMAGVGKGILRTTFGNPNLLIDYIPVDIAIKAMLVTAWRRGIVTITKDPSISVYNGSSCGLKGITNRDLSTMGLRIGGEIPLEGILWVPGCTMHSRKIFTANFALEYFMTQYWKFTNDKLLSVLKALPEINKSEFDYEMGNVDIPTYFKNSIIGSKLYLFKEKMSDLPKAKAHYNKLWWIDRALKVWFAVFLTWAGVASGSFAYIINCITSMFVF